MGNTGKKSGFTKINLLPKEILDQRKYELWYPWIFSIAIIVLLVIGLVYLMFTLSINNVGKEIDDINAQVAVTTAQAQTLKPYEEEHSLYLARSIVTKSALQDRMDPYLVALAITRYLPTTVSVEHITADTDAGLTITGVVEDSGGNPEDKDWKGVATAMDSLAKAPLFKTIWLTEGTMNDSYDSYEEFDKQRSAVESNNFPDVVDSFTLTGQIRLTLDSDKDNPVWTKSADEAQNAQGTTGGNK